MTTFISKALRDGINFPALFHEGHTGWAEASGTISEAGLLSANDKILVFDRIPKTVWFDAVHVAHDNMGFNGQLVLWSDDPDGAVLYSLPIKVINAGSSTRKAVQPFDATYNEFEEFISTVNETYGIGLIVDSPNTAPGNYYFNVRFSQTVRAKETLNLTIRNVPLPRELEGTYSATEEDTDSVLTVSDEGAVVTTNVGDFNFVGPDVTVTDDGDSTATITFDVSYDNLSNVPATFAPSPHPHVKSDITDFSDADYATAVHGHPMSEVTDLSPTTIQRTDAAQIDYSRIRVTSDVDASPSSTTHPFQVGPTSGANIRIDGNEVFAVTNGAVSTLFLNQNGGEVRINNSIAWHGGNDGPGSGLDADTLDGFQGSSYARSNAADTISSAWNFSGITPTVGGVDIATLDDIPSGVIVESEVIAADESTSATSQQPLLGVLVNVAGMYEVKGALHFVSAIGDLAEVTIGSTGASEAYIQATYQTTSGAALQKTIDANNLNAIVTVTNLDAFGSVEFSGIVESDGSTSFFVNYESVAGNVVTVSRGAHLIVRKID